MTTQILAVFREKPRWEDFSVERTANLRSYCAVFSSLVSLSPDFCTRMIEIESRDLSQRLLICDFSNDEN